MNSVTEAIKQIKSLKKIFKISSIVLGLVAISPVFAGLLSSLNENLIPFTNAYLANMGYLVIETLSLAFTFVALDVALRSRLKDLKEIAALESEPKVASALITTFTRNITRNAKILFIVGGAFAFLGASSLLSAIAFASLERELSVGPSPTVIYLRALQPLITVFVFVVLGIILRSQARKLLAEDSARNIEAIQEK